MNRTHIIRATLAVAVVVVIGCGQVSVPTGGAGPSTSQSRPTSQSVAPSVEPSVAATAATPPGPPIEITGRITCGPPVSPDRAGTQEAVDVGDDGMTVSRSRGGAWHQTVTMSDPRLEGAVYHTYESDEYTEPGAEEGPLIWAATHRIENEKGRWESRAIGGAYADGAPIGNSPEVFIGEGTYEGMIAIMEVSLLEGACGADVRGVIFGDGPVPEPYKPG